MMLKTTAGAAALSFWSSGLLPRRAPGAEPTPAPSPPPVATPTKFPNFELEPIRTEQIAPGFSVLSGPGGNVGVLAGKDDHRGGTLVVDTGIRARAAEVRRAVVTVAGNPPGAG